eukprot:6861482-Prymnesium_polylepis.1
MSCAMAFGPPAPRAALVAICKGCPRLTRKPLLSPHAVVILAPGDERMVPLLELVADLLSSVVRS